MTVYFALEENSGRVKIGHCDSLDPQTDRIDPHLTLTTSVVSVLAALPGASVATERALHDTFRRHRVMRRDASLTEFFRPSPELWSLIGWVQRHKSLPCPPEGCGSLVWDPR